MAGATPPDLGLPEEIVNWEILVRLPPKALLRCSAVCRAWRRVTSSRDFLQAHHDCQPSLHFLYSPGYAGGLRRNHKDILAFDNQASKAVQLHTIARLDRHFLLEASCDGFLILSGPGRSSICCNPATRQHAPLGIVTRDFYIVGMYLHRPTDEYRLLLQWIWYDHSRNDPRIGFYVFVLGSDQSPRYIGWPQASLGYFNIPARAHDSLHWYISWQSNLITVFDTITESFGRMRAPTIPDTELCPHIFEADGTLGMHIPNRATEDIWVLQNYEGEVWNLKYQIKLPDAKIMRGFGGSDDLYVNVALEDGRVFLMVSVGEWVLHIDSDGKLVDSFHCVVESHFGYRFRFKQTLVPHTFLTTPEGSAVNNSPFI